MKSNSGVRLIIHHQGTAICEFELTCKNCYQEITLSRGISALHLIVGGEGE